MDNNQSAGQGAGSDAPTHNQGDGQDPPDVVVIDMAGKNNRRIFMVAVILLVVGFLPGWLLLWQSDRQQNQEAPSAAVQTSTSEGMSCDQRLKRYENTFMDLGFCYPQSWGEALVQDGKFEPTDSGSRWRVTFTTKSQITLGLVTPDWSSTVPRSSSCLDPATQATPSFAQVNTAWKTEGDPIMSGSRSIEVEPGKYRIEEYVADLTTNGVCLTGYVQLGGMFRHGVATYYSEFSPVIVSPEHHIDNPNSLITGADRAEFAAFVKSIRRL